jgi:hypothetical protein
MAGYTQIEDLPDFSNIDEGAMGPPLSQGYPGTDVMDRHDILPPGVHVQVRNGGGPINNSSGNIHPMAGMAGQNPSYGPFNPTIYPLHDPSGVIPPMFPSWEGYEQPTQSLNCLDVANHIQSCPICSQLYKHDTTPYVIIIAILALLSILLIKKVMKM